MIIISLTGFPRTGPQILPLKRTDFTGGQKPLDRVIQKDIFEKAVLQYYPH
jgi:hypothetical protein